MIRLVQTAIVNFQGELSERHSLASESGSSTDSHADIPEGKDGELDRTYLILWDSHDCGRTKHKVWSIYILLTTVKKKYGPALKFSNLMNIGKKKLSSQEIPDKCVDTSGEQNSGAHGRPDHDTTPQLPSVSAIRLPQCSSEQSVAYLLVSHQKRPVVVLPRQRQEQSEPAGRDSGRLQRFSWPQSRTPVLLPDRDGRHAAGDPGGRQLLSPDIVLNLAWQNGFRSVLEFY